MFFYIRTSNTHTLRLMVVSCSNPLLLLIMRIIKHTLIRDKSHVLHTLLKQPPLHKYNLFATVSHKLLFKHNYVEFYDNDRNGQPPVTLCHINQNQTYILWNFCASLSDNAICIGILFVHYIVGNIRPPFTLKNFTKPGLVIVHVSFDRHIFAEDKDT